MNIYDIPDLTKLKTVDEAQDAYAQAIQNVRAFVLEIQTYPELTYKARLAVNAKKYGKVDASSNTIVEEGIEQWKLERDRIAGEAKASMKEQNPKATVQALTDAGDDAARSIDEKITRLEGEIADEQAVILKFEERMRGLRDEVEAMRSIMFWARDFLKMHGVAVSEPNS